MCHRVTPPPPSSSCMVQLVAGRLRLLWCCFEFAARCGVCVCSPALCFCLLPQGFHDQPGVKPQWLLSAQRRHHLLQPFAVQLHDLQVDTRSRGLHSQLPGPFLPPTAPPPHNGRQQRQHSPCPSPSSLDSVPLAQTVSIELKHACTNRRQRIKRKH